MAKPCKVCQRMRPDGEYRVDPRPLKSGKRPQMVVCKECERQTAVLYNCKSKGKVAQRHRQEAIDYFLDISHLPNAQLPAKAREVLDDEGFRY